MMIKWIMCCTVSLSYYTFDNFSGREDELNQVNEAAGRQVCQGSVRINRSMREGPHAPETR
jgi:hypothetical protein